MREYSELSTIYINIPWTLGDTIKLTTNCEDLFEDVFVSSYKYDNTFKKIVGHIELILVPAFVRNCESDQFIAGNGFMPKSDNRYIPGIENTVYIENVKDISNSILTMYYPYHAIIHSNYDHNQHLVICGNKGAMKICIAASIKKSLSIALERLGFYPLHASCVCNENGALVILGRGRSGKTTLFLNLISSGFKPINDDIVFVKLEEDGMYVYSLPFMPSVRAESIHYIVDSAKYDFSKYERGIDNEYYIDIEKIYDTRYIYKARLNKVIIPLIDTKNQSASYSKISPEQYKKRVLRCFRDHSHNISINEAFAKTYYELMSKNFYEVHLSANGYDNIDAICDFV